jgi:DNA-binding NarL/FixJ family response regulator
MNERTHITSAITPRELDVLRLMHTGLLSKQIAKELGVSQRTVDSHRGNLLSKTGCRNSFQLGVWAVRKKLLPECHPSRELCQMQLGAGV